MAETTNTVQAEDAEIAPVQAQAAEAETTAESVPAAPETPDTDTILENKRNQWLAEWNQSKDRELAKVHQQSQARERAVRAQARQRLEQVGDEDAGAWEEQQALGE